MLSVVEVCADYCVGVCVNVCGVVCGVVCVVVCCVVLMSGCGLLCCDVVGVLGDFCLICNACSWRCSFMENDVCEDGVCSVYVWWWLNVRESSLGVCSELYPVGLPIVCECVSVLL